MRRLHSTSTACEVASRNPLVFREPRARRVPVHELARPEGTALEARGRDALYGLVAQISKIHNAPSGPSPST